MRRTLSTSLCVLGVAILGMFAASPQVAADTGGAGRGYFLLSVFDCYMPVPDSFVLNTRDTSVTDLTSTSLSSTVTITISRYTKKPGGSFTLLTEKKTGGLVVEEYRNSVRKDLRVTRIHDGEQQVMVYGGTDELLDTMIHGCLERRREPPPGE